MINEFPAYLEKKAATGPLIEVIASDENIKWRTEMEPHIHRSWELKFLDDEHGGDLSLIAPRQPHSSTLCEASAQVSPSDLIINFRRAVFEFRLSKKACRINVLPELFAVLAHLDAAAGSAPCRKAVSQSILANLLQLSTMAIAEAGEDDDAPPDLFELGFGFIKRNYYRNSLGVNDVAHFVGVTPQYLNSIFRRRRQRGIRQLLIEVRLNRARELLEERTYLVGDVARLTGWSSQFYFCNRFRKHFGFSPQQLLK